VLTDGQLTNENILKPNQNAKWNFKKDEKLTKNTKI